MENVYHSTNYYCGEEQAIKGKIILYNGDLKRLYKQKYFEYRKQLYKLDMYSNFKFFDDKYFKKKNFQINHSFDKIVLNGINFKYTYQYITIPSVGIIIETRDGIYVMWSSVNKNALIIFENRIKPMFINKKSVYNTFKQIINPFFCRYVFSCTMYVDEKTGIEKPINFIMF